MICPKCGGNGSVLTARALLNPEPGPPSSCPLCRGTGAIKFAALGLAAFQSAQIEQLARALLEAKAAAYVCADLYAERFGGEGAAEILASALQAVDGGLVTREEVEAAWPPRPKAE